MNDITDIAWAAGLFDGEGCITVRKSGGRLIPELSLGLQDESTVKRFQQIVGRGNICKRGGVTFYNWQIAGIVGVFEVLQKLMPFLFLKRGEARVMLNYPIHGSGYVMNDQTITAREAIRLELRQIKLDRKKSNSNKENSIYVKPKLHQSRSSGVGCIFIDESTQVRISSCS